MVTAGILTAMKQDIAELKQMVTEIKTIVGEIKEVLKSVKSLEMKSLTPTAPIQTQTASKSCSLSSTSEGLNPTLTSPKIRSKRKAHTSQKTTVDTITVSKIVDEVDAEETLDKECSQAKKHAKVRL